MKQVLQNLRDGDTVLETVPVPVPGANELLIRSACSLVSAGTEKMLVDFGKASLLDKARSQPDKVISRPPGKMDTEGIAARCSS